MTFLQIVQGGQRLKGAEAAINNMMTGDSWHDGVGVDFRMKLAGDRKREGVEMHQ